MNEIVQFVLSAKDTTGAAFSSVRGGLNQIGEQVITVRGLVAALAATFSVGAFAAGVKAASESADAAAKMGDRFGIATEKMIGMQHAGALAGVTNESLAAGLRGIAVFGIEAARGGEGARKSLRLLNREAGEFVKLPMDRQLETVIDRLGKVENVALRNALAQQVLGKSAGEVMNLVAEGSEAFRKAAEDARDWGSAIGRVDAAKLEMANDAITRAKEAARGLFTTIAIQVAPVVKALADLWADNAKEAKGFRNEVGSAVEMIAVGITHAVNIVRGLEFAWVGLKYVIASVVDLTVQGFSRMADSFASSKLVEFARYVPGPIGLAANALKAFGTATREGLGEAAQWTAVNAAEIKKQLDEIAERGLLDPEEILGKIRALSAGMQAEAETIAARRQELRQGAGIEVPEDKAKDESGWLRDLAQRAARIQIENQTELEQLQEHLLEKQNILDIAAQEGLISDEVWQAQSAIVFAKYEEAKTKIQDEETKKRYGIQNVYRQLDLNSAGYFLGQMSGLMNSGNRKMFEVGKAAAIGKAIIDTYNAANGAYAALASIPFIGPALGAAAAAAAIIAGIANVQKIRSTEFGAGSAAAPVFAANPNTGIPIGSSGGAVPETPSPALPMRAQAAVERVATVNIYADRDTKTTYGFVVDEILPAIEEAVANGATRLNVQLNPI